jgi:hypothetical protein
MGLPPGEIAPGPGPAVAAEELAGPDGPASIDETADPDEPVAVNGPVGLPVVSRARPSTGDPRVDDAVARLDDLAGLPLAEHLAVFEYVHELLTEALGDLDVHAPARAGDQTHAPGAPGG